MALLLTKKICDILLKKKLVSESDLEKARKLCKEQGGSLSDVLVKMNAVSRDNILTTLSEELGFPPIKLSLFKISDEILELIPKKISITYQILPVSRIKDQLTVAMVDPLNIFAIDDLKTVTNLDVVPVIADEDDMREAISKYHEKSAGEEISAIVDDIAGSEMEMISGEEDMASEDLLLSVNDAPVVKLTNMILGKAVKERASDILLEPMERNSRVRYRIDGILRERFDPPKKFHQALVSRIKVMSNLDIAERRLPQDGRFMVKIEGRKVDFRVSIVPSSFGEKVALRVLDKAQATIDLDALGLAKRDKEKIRAISEKPHGMIMVCGPTGCGKTTTLYSVVKHLDKPTENIVTVEDPVEYELRGINQVSINDDIGLTFASCLRSILRQDPDIIMVGEIRDYETLDVAIKSALTGHLVLSTLHTNTASGSIIRMINMGVDPFLIAASIELIAAQRLLRKLCSNCREPFMPSKEITEKYKLFDKKGKAQQIYKPKGCDKCMGFGYWGRLAIMECMELTPKVKKIIFEGAQEADIARVAREEGMVTLRENGIENVLDGLASLEDVMCTTVVDKELS